ncbi:hypothetical protein [Vagococcus xieshaowenii]|uniref:Uncharacterized protein n=1 Tax=Vagococcus xieshaowenii TaxID=2562451 RepID=A0AAJ5EE27_9ENTE|nr:hypothetical protein [Vagococcus xieshaowenii]QCA29161.1 hypothetical protein E4Z98_07475 [Vagococcus xieshaowenii]TFZ40861.1 hypothetical protein E4031_05615 [Vagococcus xieshaowenii]
MESEYDLMNYLEIDSIIEQLHKKKDRVATEMNLKSFHTRVVFDGLSVHVYAPKIDKLVNEKIEVGLVIDSLIERCNFRKKHFNRYCEELLPEELKQLMSESNAKMAQYPLVSEEYWVWFINEVGLIAKKYNDHPLVWNFLNSVVDFQNDNYKQVVNDG